MSELDPDFARAHGLAVDLTRENLQRLQQGDLVIVRCDDGIERVGHFAHIDTGPYWTVFPMDLVITLGKRGGVSRRQSTAPPASDAPAPEGA